MVRDSATPTLFAGFGSGVAVLRITALRMIVLPGRSLFTLTTSVKVASAPAARAGASHVTVPVAPMAGVLHVQPPGAVSDWNVLSPGMRSAILTLWALAG